MVSARFVGWATAAIIGSGYAAVLFSNRPTPAEPPLTPLLWVCKCSTGVRCEVERAGPTPIHRNDGRSSMLVRGDDGSVFRVYCTNGTLLVRTEPAQPL
jgi:hypothetical protein